MATTYSMMNRQPTARLLLAAAVISIFLGAEVAGAERSGGEPVTRPESVEITVPTTPEPSFGGGSAHHFFE